MVSRLSPAEGIETGNDVEFDSGILKRVLSQIFTHQTEKKTLNYFSSQAVRLNIGDDFVNKMITLLFI